MTPYQTFSEKCNKERVNNISVTYLDISCLCLDSNT
jgi:hypothetical protein